MTKQKPKAMILDNNPLSISKYMEEHPEVNLEETPSLSNWIELVLVKRSCVDWKKEKIINHLKVKEAVKELKDFIENDELLFKRDGLGAFVSCNRDLIDKINKIFGEKLI